jgi:hypothetical protein
MFRVLFVFVVLNLEWQKLLHLHATAHPTAQWTAQQMVEAFPWETTARYLTRDRDWIYGVDFQRRVAEFGFNEVPTAPRSPGQNPYAERFIGSLPGGRPLSFWGSAIGLYSTGDPMRSKPSFAWLR